MAPRIFFRVPLVCSNCGTLNEAHDIQLSSSLGSDPEWAHVEPGEALHVAAENLELEFLVLRPPEGPAIAAIEFFICNACRLYSPAMLRFRERTPEILEFVGADAVRALTKEILDEANYVTRSIEEWTAQPGEDEARIEELKRRI
jgi:hypothetical protein